MMWNLRHLSTALWQYLNQPLCDVQAQPIWQLNRFWYIYQIQFLEACWQKDINSEKHYSQ